VNDYVAEKQQAWAAANKCPPSCSGVQGAKCATGASSCTCVPGRVGRMCSGCTPMAVKGTLNTPDGKHSSGTVTLACGQSAVSAASNHFDCRAAANTIFVGLCSASASAQCSRSDNGDHDHDQSGSCSTPAASSKSPSGITAASATATTKTKGDHKCRQKSGCCQTKKGNECQLQAKCEFVTSLPDFAEVSLPDFVETSLL
jgi:hypothetical protein